MENYLDEEFFFLEHILYENTVDNTHQAQKKHYQTYYVLEL